MTTQRLLPGGRTCNDELLLRYHLVVHRGCFHAGGAHRRRGGLWPPAERRQDAGPLSLLMSSGAMLVHCLTSTRTNTFSSPSLLSPAVSWRKGRLSQPDLPKIDARTAPRLGILAGGRSTRLLSTTLSTIPSTTLPSLPPYEAPPDLIVGVSHLLLASRETTFTHPPEVHDRK